MKTDRGHSRLLARLLKLEDKDRFARLATLTKAEREELATHWRLWARRQQLPPEGEWRLWLVLAGRGFGKTRAGAEWVREVTERDPAARIALVGATLAEARAVMVEGESGILAISPPERRPVFEPSLRRLTWPCGAQATLFSAAEPESLRGPQHSHAWCDEIGKWENPGGKALAAWDNLQLGLRLGDRPQVLATTTPRAVPLVERLLAEPDCAVTRGRTEDNAGHLPERFLAAMRRQYGRSRPRRRRSSSSTRRMRLPMRCSTRPSKALRARRLPPPRTASAGWSARPRPATGPAEPARSPVAREETGSSSGHATGCACWIVPPGRSVATSPGNGARPRFRPLRPAERQSTQKRGQPSAKSLPYLDL